jgi:hypothetical protein
MSDYMNRFDDKEKIGEGKLKRSLWSRVQGGGS